MNDVTKQALSKVPAVTLGFWVIQILATTLGETGGDTVTMTLDWGYLAGVTLFGVVLVALVVAQISAKRFYRILYWATIVASTTFGTTLADFADRSLGIGYWATPMAIARALSPNVRQPGISGVGGGAYRRHIVGGDLAAAIVDESDVDRTVRLARPSFDGRSVGPGKVGVAPLL